MEDFKCTKCRRLHESEAKFCFHCGTDLEDAIMEYKEKHLPIKFERKIPSLTLEQNTETQEKEEIPRGCNVVGCLFEILADAICC